MFYYQASYKTDDKYDIARFSRHDVDIYDTLNSYMWQAISKLASSGEVRISDESGKPDLLSYRLYGTTSLWWLILTYNGILKPSKLTVGTLVKYPSLQDIEALRLSLPALEGSK